MHQLSRIILSRSSGSPDEQAATPDEQGGYGELVEEIDRIVGPAAESDPDPNEDLSEPTL